MSKIVFLFACVALLEVASALQCYDCKGSDCDMDKSSWGKRTCGASNFQPIANHKFVCLKMKYTDKTSQKEMFSRRCVYAEEKDGKATFNCPTNDGTPIECPVCDTDLCNSAQSINFSMLAFSGVVLSFLVSRLM